MVLRIGYVFGRVQGVKETLADPSFRLSVLADGPRNDLERLVAQPDHNL